VRELEGVAAGRPRRRQQPAGEALLSGFVNLEGSKTKAGEIAKGISGISKVHNKLVVAP
jgi:osmotically-inducible protein OsmY